MGELRHARTKRPLRRRSLGCIISQIQIGLLALLVIFGGLIGWSIWRGRLAPAGGTPTAVATSGLVLSSPRAPSTPTRPRPSPTPTPKVKRIGLLAGHSGPENDPGAVCEDGLREADINLAVAQKVQEALIHAGYKVDLLNEFDERLPGYQALAFLAIHTDSCEVPDVSGFKVARVSFSAIPDIEDKLVECIYAEYARATGLPRHDFSITPDMHEYHAFRQIAPETPGAIIELGFMAADRDILTKQQDKLALGIVAGLLCFLESQ